jgi:hypothetical protein
MSDKVVFGCTKGTKQVTLKITYNSNLILPTIGSETADGFTEAEVCLLISYLQDKLAEGKKPKEQKAEV